MGISEPLRRAILERTIELVDSGGEANLRVRDIAEACGVTTPNIYHAFGSREGVVVAAHTARYVRTMLEVTDWYVAQLGECKSREDLKTTVAALLDTVYDPAHNTWRLRRVSVLGAALKRPEVAAAIVDADNQFVKRSVQAMQPFADRGWLAPGLDLSAAALWYIGQVNGRVHLELGNDMVDPTAWNDTSKTAIMAVMFGELPA